MHIYGCSRRIYCLNSYKIYSKFDKNEGFFVKM